MIRLGKSDEEKGLLAVCPVCGKRLFRGGGKGIKITCSRCCNKLIVEADDDQVSVIRYETDDPVNKAAESPANYAVW